MIMQFEAPGGTLKFEYFADTDTLYIQLRKGLGVDAREVATDIVFDYNESVEVIGIEFEHASERTDLMNVQLSSLPVKHGASVVP